jgi:hypothetical protein
MLMSEEAALLISNPSKLLEKAFAFQEQLMVAKQLCDAAKYPTEK